MTGVVSHRAGPFQYETNNGLIEARLLAIDNGDLARLTLDSASSEGWQYLECDAIAINVDSQPLATGESNHRGRATGRGRQGRGVLESVSVDIEPMVVQSLCSGQVARIRICNDVFSLLHDDQRVICEFGASVWGETGSPATSASPQAQ